MCFKIVPQITSCPTFPMDCSTCTRLNFVKPHGQVKCGFHTTGIPMVSSISLCLRNQLNHVQTKGYLLQLRSIRDDDTLGLSDLPSSSREHEGSGENNDKCEEKSSSSVKILKKLRRYGISGILSYGLLNTAYYLSAFLLTWFYIAPAPGRMGYWAAVKRFLKLMAMVWAGSQVTKVARAGGALALAPIVERGLSWFMAKYKFTSQAKAFTVVVGCCFGLAAVLFIVVTLLWA